MIDLFFKISTYGYGISGLVVVGSFISIIISLIKRDKKAIIETITWKWAIYFYCVAIVCAPLDFYRQTINLIPEKTYYITTKLSIAGEKNPFSVDAKIEYNRYVDYEYYESSNGILETTKTKIYVDEVFSLIDYSFNGYEIENLPEVIQSFGEYKVFIWMPTDEYDDSINNDNYSPRCATIQIPAITKENLGITESEVLDAYGKINIAEHIAVFTLGAIGFILWLKLKVDDNY